MQMLIDWIIKIWNLLCAFKRMQANKLGQGGWRYVAGAFVPTWLVMVYSLCYMVVSGLFSAIMTLFEEAPGMIDAVSNIADGNVNSVTSGNWLVWANYVLPLDFLVSCLVIYYSCYSLVMVFRIYQKMVAFISAVAQTVK
jgi:hypothetical protein